MSDYLCFVFEPNRDVVFIWSEVKVFRFNVWVESDIWNRLTCTEFTWLTVRCRTLPVDPWFEYFSDDLFFGRYWIGKGLFVPANLCVEFIGCGEI